MRILVVTLLTLLTIALPGRPGFPQSDDLKALRQEIETLKEEQRALRKDFQDLATSLRERGGPAPRDVRDLTIGVARVPPRETTTPCSPAQWAASAALKASA